MSIVLSLKINGNNKIQFFKSQSDNYEKDDLVVVAFSDGDMFGTIYSKLEKEINAPDEDYVVVKRKATPQDITVYQNNKVKSNEIIEFTKSLVKKYNLQMSLVNAILTLDGKKVIISYVCDERVDFRLLVKELATYFKIKVELKQIGIRDQAKLVGGIGSCGQECCCIRYLNDFDKVSIKMAKTQNLSLNPLKISGICGRLMCCLAYENDHYEDTSTRMPKLNSEVSTPQGKGYVVYNNLLKELCSVKIVGQDTKIVEIKLEEVKFTEPMNSKKCCANKNNI